MAPAVNVRDRQTLVFLFVCACCFWAIAAAGNQHAECKLVLLGDNTTASFSEVVLECSSETGTLVDIAVDPALKDFAQAFKGVNFREELQCQGRNAADTAATIYPGLIAFCGNYSVNFNQPVVKNVRAGYELTVEDDSNLLLFGGQVTVTISAGVFEGNSEVTNVLVLMGNAQVDVRDGTLFSNNSGGTGTCAATAGRSSLRITNSTLRDNSAVFNAAGVVSWERSSIVIRNSQLTGNVVGKDGEGGAFLARGKSTMELESTLIAFNSAGYSGGAAAAWNQASLRISNSRIVNNMAPNAGAVVARNNALLVIINSTASNSSVHGHAAWDSARVVVTDSVIFNSQGMGLHLTDNSVVVVNGSSTVAGKVASGFDGAGVQVEKNATLTVQGVFKLLNNTSDLNGGGLAVLDSGMVNLVTHPGSLCAGNSAQYGGCLWSFSDAVVNVTGAINITENEASVDGGGFYTNGKLVWSAISKYVYGNQADWGGGVFLNPNQTDVLAVAASTFNNTAEIDPDLSVPPTNLGFSRPSLPQVAGNASIIFGNASQSLALLNASHSTVPYSVASTNGVLSVQLFVWGAGNWPCEGYIVQAKHAERGFLSSNTTGKFGLVNITMYNLAPGTQTLTFSLPDYPEVAPVSSSFVVQGCVKGQVLRPGGACQDCPAGSFSQQPTDSSCSACPANAECSGGATILPHAGFWHSSVGASQIYRCPNPLACVGNRTALWACSNTTSAAATTCTAVLAVNNRSSYSDLQCSTGYTGSFCGVCAEGFGSARPFTCRLCRPKTVILGLYICAAILLLGFMKVLCHFTRAENAQMRRQQQQQQQQASLPVTGLRDPAPVESKDGSTIPVAAQAVAGSSSSSSSSTSAKMLATDLLKPAVIYMQYLLIVGSLSGVEWPPPLLLSFQALAWAWSSTSPETVTIECILAGSRVAPAYLKTVFYLCAPISMLVALLLIEWASMQLARWRESPAVPAWVKSRGSSDSSNSSSDGRLASTCVVVVFFFLPVIVRSALSLFACIPLDGTSVWSQDTNTVCYTGYHRTFALALGLPLVLLVCVALPTWVFVLTLRARCKHNLTSPAFHSSFGFLVRPYRTKYCWWEGVVICQTIMLVAISVFAHTLGAFNQAIILNAGIALVLLLLVMFKPHAHREANHVMQHAMCCLLLTSYVALTFLPTGGSVQINPVYGSVMGSFVLIVNLAFAGSLVWRFARLVEWNGVCRLFNSVWGRITSVFERSKKLFQHDSSS